MVRISVSRKAIIAAVPLAGRSCTTVPRVDLPRQEHPQKAAQPMMISNIIPGTTTGKTQLGKVLSDFSHFVVFMLQNS